MSRIDELISQLCPDGVLYRPLGRLGRRNKGTPITASKMKTLALTPGPVRVFAGGQTVADVREDAVPAKDVIRVPSIIVKSRGNIGFAYYDGPFTHKSELWSYSIDDRDVDQKFVYYFLLTQVGYLQELARATSVKLPQLSVRDTDNLRVPVPPLEVQREIVRILNQFTQFEGELKAELAHEIESREEQRAYHLKQIFDSVDGFSHVTLNEIADFFNAKAHEKLVDPEGDVALLTSRFISTNGRMARFVNSGDVLTPALKDDVALVMSDLPNGRALARTFFVDANGKYAANQRVCLLRSRDHSVVLPRFLFYVLNRNPRLLAYDNGSDQTHLKKAYIQDMELGLPPLQEQQRVVAILDELETQVSELLDVQLPAEIAARRKQYEYYRDKLLTFKEATV